MNIIAWNKETDTSILFNGAAVEIDNDTGIGSDGVYYDGHWACFIGDRVTKKQYNAPVTPEPPSPIRNISTGAMQRRFTIAEEVFITSDPAATVIKSRLLNASFCNLDFQDTIDGVTYICGVLLAGGIITDAEVRVSELLADGEESEKP